MGAGGVSPLSGLEDMDTAQPLTSQMPTTGEGGDPRRSADAITCLRGGWGWWSEMEPELRAKDTYSFLAHK